MFKKDLKKHAKVLNTVDVDDKGENNTNVERQRKGQGSK